MRRGMLSLGLHPACSDFAGLKRVRPSLRQRWESFWEKKLGGAIIWQATTMEIIADFLDRVQAERDEAAKNSQPKTT